MEKLNELKEAFYPQYGTPGSRDMDVTARRKVIDENIEAVAEHIRALEQHAEDAAYAQLAGNVKEIEASYLRDIQMHIKTISDLQQRAEAAEALNKHLELAIRRAEACSEKLRERAEAAETKLAELARRPPVGNFYEDGPGNWWQIGPHDKVPHVTPLFTCPVPAADLVPEGWKLVPVEPTERMVIDGFESAPSPIFSEPEEWAKYESMSGCQQAAYKARLCWAAMLAAAPEVV